MTKFTLKNTVLQCTNVVSNSALARYSPFSTLGQDCAIVLFNVDGPFTFTERYAPRN